MSDTERTRRTRNTNTIKAENLTPPLSMAEPSKKRRMPDSSPSRSRSSNNKENDPPGIHSETQQRLEGLERAIAELRDDLRYEQARGDMLDKELKIAQIFIKGLQARFDAAQEELKRLRNTEQAVQEIKDGLEALELEKVKAEVRRFKDVIGTVGRYLFATSYAKPGTKPEVQAKAALE
ncbi:hypothetical protein CVT26_013428 [Gymnopilus dilepis]|uniref:Uncharacterized protein n=1 Tax=Gymnopilus dilepis TaxID=231916 RepID=A0A409WVB6_9AGAR|nr:hypothetical protein CVT26_013428 [Gymnopilus dilepis]